MDNREILAIRKGLGLTQAEFAKRLKVDPRTVSRLERGESKPSLPILKRLRRQTLKVK